MSAATKAAAVWRQNELEKRGKNWRYQPSGVEVAFVDGAKWVLGKAKEKANADNNGMATEEIAFAEYLEALFAEEKK
jgi:hypothetical protein